MKKVIGIFSIAALVVTMFVNTNIKSSNLSDFSLLDLVNLNSANAEEGCVAAWDECDGYSDHDDFTDCMDANGCS